MRLATRAQNARNRRCPRDNTSGHKGVGWDKRANKWRATIGTGGKNIHLGLFDNTKAAAAAYAAASKRYHGVFGREARDDRADK